MSINIPAVSRLENLSFGDILRLGAGGAVGGFAAFLMMNSQLRGRAMFGQGDMENNYLVGLLLGAAIGAAIGAGLIAAEEWHTLNAPRIVRRMMLGALAGTACGALGGLDGQFVYTVVQWTSRPLARVLGWALMGAGAGICPGLVAHSRNRAELGAYGGLAGGAVGGMLLGLVARITGSEDLSRLLGFLLLGAAIGIAVGIIQEIAKEYWLTILTGSKEGQSIMLSKEQMTVGRDETADISLFGDKSVQKRHALIIKTEAGVSITSLEAAHPVTINSQAAASAALSDGDIIGIGRHRLRFRARETAVVAAPAALIAQASAVSGLQAISGPHSGASFTLAPPVALIGRTPDSGIPLTRDNAVSRRHARLVWDGSAWHIEDWDSSNGVFVNGAKVREQVLRVGDVITVGGTGLRVV